MKTSTKVAFSGRRPFRAGLRASLREVLETLLLDHDTAGTVSVVFVDDEEIRRVHREFFGEDSVTDVVTFPMRAAGSGGEDGGTGADPLDDDLLGEVLVSVDTARRESAERDLPLERELALYSIHGVLHILGYDDREPAARRQMKRMERRYLEKFPL